MAGYPEDNQHALNGYEEEEEVEEVEEVDEEDGHPGRRGRRDGGDGGGYGDAGGEDGRLMAGGGDSSGKIFVGGVAWETTDESFSKHFAKYGAITDSVIMKDKHTKMPRGFGFVTFSDPSVIDKVLEDEHNIDGRTVEVKRTVPREEMSSKDGHGPKTRKIFVGGLPPALTEDDLKEHFSAYGAVVEHQIMVDHSTGRSRGFGFVTFESEDSVERVISEGRMRDLGGKQVEIKKAEPKKHGGDSNGRSSHGGGGGYRSSHRSGGGGGSSGGGSGSGGSGYGYGAGHRSAAGSYYDSTGYGYGRGGYGAYGGNAGFGSGFGGGYGGSMYGGAYGAYGAYGAGAYGAGAYGGGGYGGGAYGGGAYGGAPGAYGAGGYGSYGGGAGGAAGGSAGGRGSSRYHPYGK